MLCRWEKLPPFMQTKEVWPYYQALAARRGALLAKRTFDFTLSTLMLAFLWPLFLCLAIWIRLDSPGPAFFRQERITQYGRPFRIYKLCRFWRLELNLIMKFLYVWEKLRAVARS